MALFFDLSVFHRLVTSEQQRNEKKLIQVYHSPKENFLRQNSQKSLRNNLAKTCRHKLN